MSAHAGYSLSMSNRPDTCASLHVLWSRGNYMRINFDKLLWNYESIITFTENQTFSRNSYTTKIWSHTVA